MPLGHVSVCEVVTKDTSSSSDSQLPMDGWSGPEVQTIQEDSSAEAERQRRDQLSNLVHVCSEGRTEEELQALRQLLLEAHDVFALGEMERGEVKEVEHEIHTGDHPPIRQYPRRVPFSLRPEITRLVNEMLATGESPFYLLYGRDARVAMETALSQPHTPYQVDMEDY